MRVLQINCVFRKGSTGKIVNDIHSTLESKGINSYVSYGRGIQIDEINIFKFCSEIEAKIQGIYNRLGGLQYGGNFLSTHRLISEIKNKKPDIIHLHCINGYCVNIYTLLKFIAKSEIPTVITHHAEFFYTGSCGYSLNCNQWKNQNGCMNCSLRRNALGTLWRDNSHNAWCKMKKAFSYFQTNKLIFVAVSPWVKERSQESPILNSFPCEVVMNGIDTQIFYPYLNKDNIFDSVRKKDEKIVLHVTASFSTEIGTLKGGYHIIELAKMMPDVTFVVVASNVSISHPLPENIYFWGKAKSQVELAQMYSSADLSLIVSKRETFSMICAESLCCGTPIVGFKAGGPESIALPKYSEFVEYGNIQQLKYVIENKLHQSYNKNQIAEAAKLTYSANVMVDNYIKVYNKILGN